MSGTLAIPLTTIMLIRDLHAAVNEDEKKVLRVALLDVLHESISAEERDMVQDALIDEAHSSE